MSPLMHGGDFHEMFFKQLKRSYLMEEVYTEMFGSSSEWIHWTLNITRSNSYITTCSLLYAWDCLSGQHQYLLQRVGFR